jgi:trehalose synthase-fused probable maltokinase
VSEPAPARVDSAADLFLAEASPLLTVLPEFLSGQRWFAGKNKSISRITMDEAVPVATATTGIFWLAIIEVRFDDQTGQRYALPLSIKSSTENDPSRIVTFFEADNPDPQAVFEASSDPEYWSEFLRSALSNVDSASGTRPGLRFLKTDPDLTWSAASQIAVEFPDTEQSNTSVILDGRYFLKMFRRPSAESNPDVEVASFLTVDAGFVHSPRVTGHVEFLPASGPPECLALISELVPAESDAWTFTLDQNDEFWQRLFLSQKMLEVTPPTVDWSIASCGTPLPDDAELIGDFLDDAKLLGRRTAELHIALSSDPDRDAFRPEPATPESFQGLLATIRGEVDSTRAMLESANLPDPIASELPGQIQAAALAQLAKFEAATSDIACRQIRVHGDYHLGQILRTGDDFVIIDFEGEPDRPISERREKRSALKDVAGLVRSFHYATCTGAAKLTPALDDRSIPENVTAWQNFWFGCSARVFLEGYLETATGQVSLPDSPAQTQQLLDLYLLEKVLYELRYELNNRPDWVAIPLAGLKAVLKLQE